MSAASEPVEPDWPDISEMVDAIEKATIALTLSENMPAKNPFAARIYMKARGEALAACRQILTDIEAAGSATS